MLFWSQFFIGFNGDNYRQITNFFKSSEQLLFAQQIFDVVKNDEIIEGITEFRKQFARTAGIGHQMQHASKFG